MDDLSPEKLAKWKEICSPEEIEKWKDLYTPEEVKKWKDRLKKMGTRKNAAGDLYLEPSEIIEAARKDDRLMDEEKAKRWIKRLDTDHDGKVSFEEFLKAYAGPWE